MLKKMIVTTALLASTAVHADSAAIEAYNGSPTVPTLSTPLLINADGALNAALRDFLLKAPTDQNLLAGKRIAILSTDGVEEIELTGPLKWLRDRGATAHLVAPRHEAPAPQYGVKYPEQRATHILTVRFFENASWVKIDRFLDEVKSSEYDAVIIPGGAWNPDSLRVNADALSLLKSFAKEGKPIASLCHGPLVLVSAGLLAGKRATAYWNIHVDLANAGATVVDETVVVDGNLITSRFPYDLPAMMGALSAQLTQGN